MRTCGPVTTSTRRALGAGLLVSALDGRGDAQSALRLRSVTEVAGGAATAASVELEAIYGFRGLDFVGQKTFASRSTEKGQWAVLGVTSGAWVFTSYSPRHFLQERFRCLPGSPGC